MNLYFLFVTLSSFFAGWSVTVASHEERQVNIVSSS